MLRRKKPSASFALVGMSGFSVRHYFAAKGDGIPEKTAEESSHRGDSA
jgi:hypothetical protein